MRPEAFVDRTAAGRYLAEEVKARLGGQADVIVLALPRGGLPVAAEVARALGSPLDVMLVRKLGTPGQPELAMGAIATGGIQVMNRDVVDTLALPEAVVSEVVERERHELSRREEAYRGDRPVPELGGKVVVLVDDGIATGSTLLAAVQAVRSRDPRQVIVAAPVGSISGVEKLMLEGADVICPVQPPDFYAIGLHYDEFPQLTDDEVREILEESEPKGSSTINLIH